MRFHYWGRWLVANDTYQGDEWVIHNVSESSIHKLIDNNCIYFHAKAKEVQGKLVMKMNGYSASQLLSEYRTVRPAGIL